MSPFSTSLGTRCTAPGCSAPTGTYPLCKTHAARVRNYGDVNYEPPAVTLGEIPAAVRADVVRRVRRFEKPIDVAKVHGLPFPMVGQIMIAEAKRAKR
jgi:hypothetical protein